MRFSLRNLTSRPTPCLPPLTRQVALVALACAQMAAQAQQEAPATNPEPEPARLTTSPRLVESLSPAQRNEAPTFLMGERISGRPDLETVVEGQAELRKPGTVIKADRLEYDAATDRAKASGNVRINRGGNVFEGPLLELQVETFEGFFVEPRYQFLQGDAHGEASRADFVDANTTVVHNDRYTTCRRKPGPSWMPDWVLKAANIEFDSGEDVGVAHGGYLSFKDVPILPVPAISFPLSDKRKSGVLPPTIGADSVNGSQLSVPYYWNIAPQRDATITPTLMTARGVDLGGEFRYLEPTYSGVLRANYMPSDKLRSADRWGASINQTGTLDTGLPQVGSVSYLLNVNRVSDDNYWRDFTSSSNGTLTQRLLQSNGSVSWSQGPYSLSASVLKWQTLQEDRKSVV